MSHQYATEQQKQSHQCIGLASVSAAPPSPYDLTNEIKTTLLEEFSNMLDDHNAQFDGLCGRLYSVVNKLAPIEEVGIENKEPKKMKSPVDGGLMRRIEMGLERYEAINRYLLKYISALEQLL